MSDAKHTRGPWRRQAKTGAKRFRIVDAAGHQVADANHFNVDAEANADLLAAAPELLDALNELDAALNAAWSAGALPASVISAELAQRCRAAVAKATGSVS